MLASERLWEALYPNKCRVLQDRPGFRGWRLRCFGSHHGIAKYRHSWPWRLVSQSGQGWARAVDSRRNHMSRGLPSYRARLRCLGQIDWTCHTAAEKELGMVDRYS